MRVTDFGYVRRKTHGYKKPPSSKPTYRDWWLVKHTPNYDSGMISLGAKTKLYFPKKYVGKKIMLKVEVIQ